MGLWSVLQTIPIDGSSGKGREFPLDLNSRRFFRVSQGCATGLRNNSSALAAFVVVSPRLSVPLRNSRAAGFTAFSKTAHKNGSALPFVAVAQSLP
jgi:hypothetical protein